MEPVFREAWATGIAPLTAGDITPEVGFIRAMAPFREFMGLRTDPDTLAMFIDLAPERMEPGEPAPLSVLVPSFMLSEIQRGFEVGFLVFLPFLIIDLVIAAILMSMGMMMVPPAVVSLPFKLAFFVLADGWTLLAGAMIRGYSG